MRWKNGRAEGNHFIGIQSVWLVAEQLFHKSANFRDARGTADEDYFVNLFGLEAGIFQRLLAGADGAVDDGPDKLFELLTRDLAGDSACRRGF